jgi:hypothetical protein
MTAKKRKARRRGKAASGQANGEGAHGTESPNHTQGALPAALVLATERGWHIFPAPPGEKKSYKAGKHSNGHKWGMTKDPDEIRLDFTRWPEAGIGVPTGPENGIWVLEVDTIAGHGVDGVAELNRLTAVYGPMPPTRQARSPSGSIHYYFRWPDDVEIRNSASKVGGGIDVRGAGGMVLAPPTVRPGVGAYEWLNNNPILPAPGWLITLVTHNDAGERAAGADPEAEPERVAFAVAVIPNNKYIGKANKEKFEFGWDNWNTFGMTIWRATGGSEEGYKIFDGWSQKNADKYNAKHTRERWDNYRRSPPNAIGFGSIHWWATKADPDWERRYDVAFQAKLKEAMLRGKATYDERMRRLKAKANGGEDKAKADAQQDEDKDQQQQQDDAQPLVLILELAIKLWGPGQRISKGQWRFGANDEIAVDAFRATWFNFATNKYGGLKDLARMAGGNEADTNQVGELTSVCAADVEIEDYEWLWPERFALGKIGLLVGLPEEGKGLFICDMTARITHGMPWPCNEGTALPGNVVMLSAEDDLHDTLVPRLIAAGTDTKRVHIIKMVQDVDTASGKVESRMFSLVTDLEALRRKVNSVGDVKMVVVDPITAYLGVKKIDSYRATDVRAVLGPLQEFAERERLLVLGVMHFNKKQDVVDVLLRISDSLAFGAVARHVYGVINDPDNSRKFFVRAKNNIVKFGQKSLAFWFAEREAGISKRTGKTLIRPHIVWADKSVDISANEALQAASETKSSSALTEAKQFLERLLNNGPISSNAVYEAAKEHGISKASLRRAKDKLNIEIRKDGPVVNGEITWRWHMPPQPEQPF